MLQFKWIAQKINSNSLPVQQYFQIEFRNFLEFVFLPNSEISLNSYWIETKIRINSINCFVFNWIEFHFFYPWFRTFAFQSNIRRTTKNDFWIWIYKIFEWEMSWIFSEKFKILHEISHPTLLFLLFFMNNKCFTMSDKCSVFKWFSINLIDKFWERSIQQKSLNFLYEKYVEKMHKTCT